MVNPSKTIRPVKKVRVGTPITEPIETGEGQRPPARASQGSRKTSTINLLFVRLPWSPAKSPRLRLVGRDVLHRPDRPSLVRCIKAWLSANRRRNPWPSTQAQLHVPSHSNEVRAPADREVQVFQRPDAHPVTGSLAPERCPGQARNTRKRPYLHCWSLGDSGTGAVLMDELAGISLASLLSLDSPCVRSGFSCPWPWEDHALPASSSRLWLP